MPFDFSFFGGKKEQAEASAMDIERQLEKVSTELADKIHKLKNSLELAPNDLTAEDRRLIDEVTTAAAAEGLNEAAVRSFIFGQDAVNETAEVEDMQITSYAALATLFTNNETVVPLVERLRDGEMTLAQLQEALHEAGYTTDEHFTEYTAQYLDATAELPKLAA